MSLDATLSKLHLHICTHMTLHDLLWPLISDLENSSRPHCCRKYMSKFYLGVSSIYRIYNSSVVVMWPWPLTRDLDTWSVCFTSVKCKYLCKFWFKSSHRFMSCWFSKNSLVVAACPWPLTLWPWKSFQQSHLHDEHLWQVSLKSVHEVKRYCVT